MAIYRKRNEPLFPLCKFMHVHCKNTIGIVKCQCNQWLLLVDIRTSKNEQNTLRFVS